MPDEHKGLPVHGYQSQPTGKIDVVNENKIIEERLLRRLDNMSALASDIDGRWLAVARTHFEQARTHFEQGFMALNRAVFKPGRVALPEDNANGSV